MVALTLLFIQGSIEEILSKISDLKRKYLEVDGNIDKLAKGVPKDDVAQIKKAVEETGENYKACYAKLTRMKKVLEEAGGAPKKDTEEQGPTLCDLCALTRVRDPTGFCGIVVLCGVAERLYLEEINKFKACSDSLQR